jgi:hypothetical protein
VEAVRTEDNALLLSYIEETALDFSTIVLPKLRASCAAIRAARRIRAEDLAALHPSTETSSSSASSSRAEKMREALDKDELALQRIRHTLRRAKELLATRCKALFAVKQASQQPQS